MTKETVPNKPAGDDVVRIFDTTLRDGEQAPGFSMNPEEKLRLAQQLARLRVDIIEAGFPASSEGDFESVRQIAKVVEGPTIAGLARASVRDIDRAWEAVREAGRHRIHTFIATSDIHMRYKLRMTEDEVYEAAAKAVAHARSRVADVEFSCEDATRSRPEFLVRVFQAAIDAGATTLNVPDTVGYTVPGEYGHLIRYLRENLRGLDGVVFSAHCHDDLGLAVANTVAGIEAGVRQVECTINGIGERAGNTSLEEIVMAMRLRRDVFGVDSGLDARQLYPASRLLCQITGTSVQPNKAIVGGNAFAHEAGIHQDGVLKHAQTYEIMKPEDVGVPANKLVLGKHSGRHAFRSRLAALGFDLGEDEIEKAFRRFKLLADQKKEIYDEDIEAIVADEVVRSGFRYELRHLWAESGSGVHPHARVTLEIDGETQTAEAEGDGPVDAALNAIKALTGTTAVMRRYAVAAISGGTDAQGEVSIRIEDNGRTVAGQASDTDIVIASAKAYVHALNKLAWRSASPARASVTGEVGP